MQYFLNDLFWTIQGEGHHAGRRALFVRMPYCNLSCSWCDTSFNSYEKISSEVFESIATSEPAKFAVITGGEPMMNRHTPIVVTHLKQLGFEVACETNGTFPIVSGIDYPTCSPKRDAEYFIHPEAEPLIKEFKYVVDDGFDFSILDRHNTSDGRRYSLSPEFNKMNESVSNIEKYIAKNPGWRLNLQTHKWIGVK